MSKIEERYLKELENIINDKENDTEVIHSNADQLIIKLLKELGFNEFANMFDKMDKWYA